MTSIGNEAGALLRRHDHGVLATHSVEMPGYPFGSVTPYCLDRAGEPVIYISRLAQHTKNIAANPLVALLVADEGEVDVQTLARASYLARAEPLADPDPDVAERYFHHFPGGRDYQGLGDFVFHRLVIWRAHYVGGFGRIRWIDRAELVRANPFTAGEEAGIIEHMNTDHREALQRYCRRAGIANPPADGVRMVGVDGDGCALRLGSRYLRLTFASPVASLDEVRRALIALAS